MRVLAGLLAALAIFATPVAAHDARPDQDAEEDSRKTPVGLMGTVPLYWGEAAGFEELLGGVVAPHWARAVIADAGEPVPFDFLTADGLDAVTRLVLAQPRALAGEENVALDHWVRAGGHLLLFADPLMTGESRFALGDRRRPQDVALLSPILAHWGLELQFDAEQSDGLQMREFAGEALPIAMAGRLVLATDSEGKSICAIEAEGLVARCSLGKGHALIVADAAILDAAGPYPGAEAGLRALLDATFGDFAHGGESLCKGAPANARICCETSDPCKRQDE